jgi:hypothetical protein
MVVELAGQAGIPEGSLYFNIDKVGNVSAASIPIAIWDAVMEGVIDRRMRIFAPGFGAGAVAGYAVLWIDPAVIVPEDVAAPDRPATADADGRLVRTTTVEDVRAAFTCWAGGPAGPPLPGVGGEAPQHRQERFALGGGQGRIVADRLLRHARGPAPARRAVLVQEARLREERLHGDAERFGDLCDDPHRRLVQPALELAEIGVGDVAHGGKLAKRELSELALSVDQLAEGLDLAAPGILRHAGAGAAPTPSRGPASGSRPWWS